MTLINNMSQLPSERIQEIARGLDINWGNECDNDIVVRAILVYLDEEYEKKQSQHKPLPKCPQCSEWLGTGSDSFNDLYVCLRTTCNFACNQKDL